MRLKTLIISIGIMGAMGLSGCASGPQASAQDPLEPMNRRIYAFNDGLDQAVVKPVAESYVKHTPVLVQTGVRNFFNNIQDAWSTVNALLQLRPKETVNNGARVVVNTTVGVAGIFDWATPLGIPRSKHDFGQTLGRWGAPMGPYVVLPLLGPSTLRDTVGSVAVGGNPVISNLDDKGARNALTVAGVIDTRAGLLEATNTLESIALDKYSFTRALFLKQREMTTRSLFAPAEPVTADDEDMDDPSKW